MRVHGIYALKRRAAPETVLAVLADLGQQKLGVVVPFPRVAAEGTGARQKARDRRDRIGSEKREFERLLDIPSELARAEQENDAFVVLRGV